MELGVKQRLIILRVLPARGDYLTLKIVRELREALSFSEEEHKALQFKREGAGLRWDPQGDVPKDIEIGDKAREIIAQGFETLSKQGKLTMGMLPLYEKFVEV